MIAAASGVVLSAVADDKKKLVISDPTAGNEKIDITASLLLEPEQIREALGVDLPKGTVAVRARVKPVDGPIRIDYDDFQIVSHKDGQRATAYAPTQLSGGPALVIKTETTSVGTGPMTRNTGPTWGGVPGTMGRPQQLPGGGGAVGNSGSGSAEVATGVEAKGGSASGAKDPVLAALKEKAIPVGEVKEPVSGLLYFALEGKHKPKDVTFIYKGPYGRLVLSFGK
jgi:hypothetical protein